MKKIIKILILNLVFSLSAMQEQKEKEETSHSLVTKINKYRIVTKINKYRSECLEKYLPKVLSNLVQQYDLIEDKWECEKTLEGHERAVWSVCILPGNQLASGSGDNTIKIWNLDTGECEKTLVGHEGAVWSVCILPGNKLASGSGDNTIKIWNLDTGECEKTLVGHKSYVVSVCILPENKLASGSDDNTIKIWNNSVVSSDSTDEEFMKFMHEKESMEKEIKPIKENQIV